MRFLFIDRILELEPGQRILATKTVTMMDEYLTAHYQRIPLVPATMVVECLLQAGGWLNLISRDFRVKTVVALIEGVQVHREARPGETLDLEAYLLYGHADGATVRAEARVGPEVIVSIDRVLLAHRETSDEAFIQEQQDRFRYLSGGSLLP